MKRRLLILVCTLLLANNAFSQEKLNADNIDEILSAMTTEEKVQLLVGVEGGMFDDVARYWAGEISIDDISLTARNVSSVSGAVGATRAIERLGIPSTVLSDGPAGLRIDSVRNDDSKTYYCTGFPIGTLLASTWNKDLVTEVGKAIGNEVKEYGCDVLLAPGMNIIRHPLCGRNFEYYSEDPVLSGNIAAAYINGVQSNGVGTSAKHFVCNNQETNRFGVNAIVSQRALRELYLKNYEIMLQKSQPWTIMSSYNHLNGPYTQENHELLTTILRKEWGFKGIVTTDWTPVRNTAAQVKAGNDLMMPGMSQQVDSLLQSIENGEIDIESVDACVHRVLEYIVKTPTFNGYQHSNNPDLTAHAETTRQSAAEGMVLLKNEDSTLPLPPASSLSTSILALFGVTSYDFMAGGTGSGDVNRKYTVDMLEGMENAGFTGFSGLKALYEEYIASEEERINSLKDWTAFEMKPRPEEIVFTVDEAREYAKKSAAAIVTLGRQSGEGEDRYESDFNITDKELQMLKNISEAYHGENKKVIVVLNIGASIETANWKDLPDAILCAWQPGQEGGNAVFDILTGKECPSGKLNQTFPIDIASVNTSANFPLTNRDVNMIESLVGIPSTEKDVAWSTYEEGVYVGYRYYDTENVAVSYPFGYGLSYTTFSYSNPQVEDLQDGFMASITVTNTGNVAGKEVVELYVSAPAGQMDKPLHELKAFAKTRALQPGESETVSMSVADYDLSSFDESQSSWVADAGQYTLQFAASCNDIRQEGNYYLTEALIAPVNNVLSGIKEMENGKWEMENGKCYSPEGLAVNSSYHGIIIKNGKKYIK